MEMVIITMLKEQLTKEVGMKINKKVEEEKNGQMALTMKENIIRVKNMETVYFNGQMGQNIMGNGKIIKCMELESSNGLTEEFIKENIKMIKSMGKAYILGLTGECIKDNFKMENSMEKVRIANPMAKKFTEYGRKEKKYKSLNL